jgi:hypothetical protein
MHQDYSQGTEKFAKLRLFLLADFVFVVLSICLSNKMILFGYFDI